jgi:hypothetical protein
MTVVVVVMVEEAVMRVVEEVVMRVVVEASPPACGCAREVVVVVMAGPRHLRLAVAQGRWRW